MEYQQGRVVCLLRCARLPDIASLLCGLTHFPPPTFPGHEAGHYIRQVFVQWTNQPHHRQYFALPLLGTSCWVWHIWKLLSLLVLNIETCWHDIRLSCVIVVVWLGKSVVLREEVRPHEECYPSCPFHILLASIIPGLLPLKQTYGLHEALQPGVLTSFSIHNFPDIHICDKGNGLVVDVGNAWHKNDQNYDHCIGNSCLLVGLTAYQSRQSNLPGLLAGPLANVFIQCYYTNEYYCHANLVICQDHLVWHQDNNSVVPAPEPSPSPHPHA